MGPRGELWEFLEVQLLLRFLFDLEPHAGEFPTPSCRNAFCLSLPPSLLMIMFRFLLFLAVCRSWVTFPVATRGSRGANKSGPYKRPAAWASGKTKSAPHEWHAAWSTGHVRRVGMVVLSKPTGAGAPERNWADVEVVFDKKRASFPRAGGEEDSDLRHVPARPDLVGEDVVNP